MTPLEERWADAALRAFLEPGNHGLIAAPDEVDYLACMRRMRAQSTRLAALGLRIAVWMVALAPMWMWHRLTPLHRLPPTDRSALMRELLSHRAFVVRELALLLKLAASIALLGTESVRARSAYDSRSRPRPKTRLPLAS